MTTPQVARPKFGLLDDELAVLPTVYRHDLFAGKVVLVSGAGTGIGKAIAFLFARLGATLVICGRKVEPLTACAEKLTELSGREAYVHPMTIRDPEQVDALMDAVWERFGRLDVLVNNAGGQFGSPAMDIGANGWNAVIDLNLNGSWYMMQAAAKRWVQRGSGGNIVNIAFAIDRGFSGVAHSSASRAAVIGLSRTLAVEWAQYGLRVNCLGVGSIESNGFNNYREEDVAAFSGSNPLMRVGDVHDIAEAVVYLAAPSGKFVTGEVINVDGGQTLWGDLWPAGKPAYYKTEGQ
ncbi:MAG: SDR family oxidoreductase [Burkholderiales bacterium]